MINDYLGHGKSGHKSVDGPPQLLAEYAYYVAELVEALQWGNNEDADSTTGSRTAMGNIKRNTESVDNGKGKESPPTPTTNNASPATTQNKIILVGHSMGAGVATILCAAFPEWFSSLVLLEGGLVARNANDAARHVRAACQRRLKSNRTLFPNHRGGGSEEGLGLSPSPRAKVYSGLDVAIKARLSTTERMPGDQSLSYEAARDLVLRATTPAAKSSSTTTDPTSSESIVFRHDPRLQWPSLQYYTREQVEAFYRDVHTSQVPVCCLSATDGWPVEAWAENLVKDVLKPVYRKQLSGSHHFHADPDSVHAVAENVLSFLEEQKL
jgi:pimeloyl-ACP methyl ester carboxylesterase